VFLNDLIDLHPELRERWESDCVEVDKLGRYTRRLRKANWMARCNAPVARSGGTNWPGVPMTPIRHGVRVRCNACAEPIGLGARSDNPKFSDIITSRGRRRRSEILRGPGKMPGADSRHYPKQPRRAGPLVRALNDGYAAAEAPMDDQCINLDKGFVICLSIAHGKRRT